VPIRVFLEDGHKFDVEAVRVMGIAYEFARSALRVSMDDPGIAAKIIELAKTGERDPDKLCDFAIEGLRPPPAA
jgi:hypothetical protein